MSFPCIPIECAQVMHLSFFSPLEEDIDAQIEEVSKSLYNVEPCLVVLRQKFDVKLDLKFSLDYS